MNIVSLTHCIICVLYEFLFANNESRNIGLKSMRLSFHFFIQSFIHSFVAFGTTARAAYDPGCREAIHEKRR